jgi:Family of unknown function (DUF6529)
MTSVFSAPIVGKAWLATAAIALAVVQVLTGARIFGKLEHIVRIPRPHVNRVHRWSGRLAVLLTLPVAFHCIFILGYQTTSTRVVIHCILGTIVYAVFTVKVFFVHDRLHPRWVLPVVGGTMATVLASLWGTSALWYFTNVHFGF